MEMPVDILNHRLGKIRDNGDIDFDNTAVAMDIDSELQEKFYFIPREEVEAVAVVSTPNNLHADWRAGDGPETIRARKDDNPSWLYNSAVHALAMMEWLRGRQETERKDRRPEPGIYLGRSAATRFTVIVTADRRILVPISHGDGGLNDCTDMWDAETCKSWTLQRVDTATGVIAQ